MFRSWIRSEKVERMKKGQAEYLEALSDLAHKEEAPEEYF